MRRSICLVLAAFLVTAPAAYAQDPGADARAAYEAALAEYKDDVRRIEALWSEYQTADEARRDAIQQENRALVAAAQEKLDAMVEAALDAFRAAPMADPQVSDLLVAVAEFQVVGKGAGGGGDQYESALPILQALVDGGHDKAELPLWGLLAAVATNDFDLADKFAQKAIESGAVGKAPAGGDAAEETWGLAMRYLQEKDRFRERWEAEKAVRDADAAADDLPRVKVETSKGDLVIELFENQAPTATANFLALVKKGFYNGVPVHRVIPHFMAQGGDPTGTGTGGPGHSIACECYRPDARDHFRGTLSMAHAGRDTGGSQFFLCFVPTDHLDGRHTAFGRVVEGLDVLGELQVVDPQERGATRDEIVKATVLRDRGHAYDYKKLPGR